MSTQHWRTMVAGLAVIAATGGGAGFAAQFAAQDEVFEDAVPLHTVDPVVSPMVHQGGTVVLRVAVTAAGRVADVEVVNGFPALTGPVVDAVTQWRFTPARLNDRPVPGKTTVVVHVALQRSIAPPVR